ncbi:uncharacterized protein LOC116267086 [Nymphaea colorata]|nr:uncharacterized protein LOC116267086 [Nymphaea colorata]
MSAPFQAGVAVHHRCGLHPPSPAALEQKLVVSGGVALSGHVRISGAKNSALPILAATLCCDDASAISRVPDLLDTRSMAAVLRSLGARVEWPEGADGGELVVDASAAGAGPPCSNELGKTRAGFLVIGPLLGRFGEAEVGLPGGCNIGARPVDLYLRGLRALGAVVEMKQDKVVAYAAKGKRLTGGTFYLNYPSVGATETLMMAASLADGVTVLLNAAKEPEVSDLAEFLTACGARVHGAGTSIVTIKGVSKLHGTEFTIIPDRIEAGTFMVAASITCSKLSMSPVIPRHLTSVIDKLSASGCTITQTGRCSLEVSALKSRHSAGLRGFDFKTCPYPGFPTDLQPQFMALLCTCNGSSLVEESVFESRMTHVEELKKLGAKIHVCSRHVLVNGKDRGSLLFGAPVMAHDIRGGAALVLAGMAAEGTTEVLGAQHIERGYENFVAKLNSLGASIRRNQDAQLTLSSIM